MNADFFQDLGTNIFKPVGNFVSGAVTALQPGRVRQMKLAEEEHKMNMARMQELLKNSNSQRRLDAINRLMKQALLENYQKTGDTAYLGVSSQRGDRFGTTPWYLSPDWINTEEGKAAREKALKSMSDIDQLKMWRGIQSSAEGQYFHPEIEGEGFTKTPKNKELYDLANKNINEIMQKMKSSAPQTQNIQEYFGSPGEIGQAAISRGETTQPQMGNQQFFAPSSQQTPTEQGQDNQQLSPQIDSWGLFTPSASSMQPTPQGQEGTDIRDLVIGPPTAPRTFGQIGITDVEDMATLQEMQKALPDRDMRTEYEEDPENMKQLMELWKQGKLNKSNLHKAFSMIQQDARQALGIA